MTKQVLIRNTVTISQKYCTINIYTITFQSIYE